MTLSLHQLKPAPGSRHRRKRVGRGNASGHGTYSTRGQKGQRARTGGRPGLKRLGFKKILQGIPKNRGFNSPYNKKAVVNLDRLNDAFKDGAVVTPAELLKRGLINNVKNGVKILGQGKLTKKLIIERCLVSAAAKQEIEAAGGQILKPKT